MLVSLSLFKRKFSVPDYHYTFKLEFEKYLSYGQNLTHSFEGRILDIILNVSFISPLYRHIVFASHICIVNYIFPPSIFVRIDHHFQDKLSRCLNVEPKLKEGKAAMVTPLCLGYQKSLFWVLNKYIILKCYFHNYIKPVRKRFVAGIMLTIEETMVINSVL